MISNKFDFLFMAHLKDNEIMYLFYNVINKVRTVCKNWLQVLMN